MKKAFQLLLVLSLVPLSSYAQVDAQLPEKFHTLMKLFRYRIYILLVFIAVALLGSRVYKRSITEYAIGDDDMYWSYPLRIIYSGDLRVNDCTLPTFRSNPGFRVWTSPFPGLLWIPAVALGRVIGGSLNKLPGANPSDVAQGISIYHRLLVSAFSARSYVRGSADSFSRAHGIYVTTIRMDWSSRYVCR